MSRQPSEDCDPDLRAFRRDRCNHWDNVAQTFQRRPIFGGSYHRRLTRVYRSLVPPGQRVLELGCGRGDLLAALEPKLGVGLDLSGHVLRQARRRHPHLHFVQTDAHDLPLDGTFDYIVLSDLVNDLWNVQHVLERIAEVCRPSTRVLLNTSNRLWRLPLGVARALKLARPALRQNWLTVGDLSNLLLLAGFERFRHWQEVLWPIPTPVIGGLCNRFLVALWPWKYLGLANLLVARRTMRSCVQGANPVVSVIVPARNEAGNVRAILDRTPELGGGTELVFVEGHSTDGTYEAIEKAVAEQPGRRCIFLRQEGEGKGDAVRAGFENAVGEVLMILDADLTVAPEDLDRFFQALIAGKGEFINGVRSVYPMQRRAMRFSNVIGNKFFSVAFSWLLGQPVKDTLCGTKVLWRRDYELIARNRAHFGDFDPFGDFDLLFGAAKLNLKITDLPVRYRERVYGTTNIQRWRHGLILLKMTMFAANRIKFV